PARQLAVRPALASPGQPAQRLRSRLRNRVLLQPTRSHGDADLALHALSVLAFTCCCSGVCLLLSETFAASRTITPPSFQRKLTVVRNNLAAIVKNVGIPIFRGFGKIPDSKI